MPLPVDAAERKMYPILRFLTEYFPDAILAMVRVAVAGNRQHNPELPPQDIVWARGKSPDHLEAAMRHLWDYKTLGPKDTDGEDHLAKAMWRIGAQEQLDIEGTRPTVVRENIFEGSISRDWAGL
jgi:hypothetical protein